MYEKHVAGPPLNRYGGLISKPYIFLLLIQVQEGTNFY